MGGKREREIKSGFWKKEERKKRRRDGGRKREGRKEKKKGGRNAELSKPEKHTQDSRARDRLGCGFLTPASPARSPSEMDAGVLTGGPPTRLQDFESLFLILLCRISLLVVDFLP